MKKPLFIRSIRIVYFFLREVVILMFNNFKILFLILIMISFIIFSLNKSTKNTVVTNDKNTYNNTNKHSIESRNHYAYKIALKMEKANIEVYTDNAESTIIRFKSILFSDIKLRNELKSNTFLTPMKDLGFKEVIYDTGTNRFIEYL